MSDFLVSDTESIGVQRLRADGVKISGEWKGRNHKQGQPDLQFVHVPEADWEQPVHIHHCSGTGPLGSFVVKIDRPCTLYIDRTSTVDIKFCDPDRNPEGEDSEAG